MSDSVFTKFNSILCTMRSRDFISVDKHQLAFSRYFCSAHMALRSPRPKFAVAKVCRIQILHRAKMQNIMCKCAKSFSFRPPTAAWPLNHIGDVRSPSYTLAVLSGNESICFSLQLCFSNNVCIAQNSRRTRNQRHKFMHG